MANNKPAFRESPQIMSYSQYLKNEQKHSLNKQERGHKILWSLKQISIEEFFY